MTAEDYSEFQRLEQSEQLVDHLNTVLEFLQQTLDDDKRFCEKDIESTRIYLNEVREELNKKIDQCQNQLEQLRRENDEICAKNQEEYDREMVKINELFYEGQRYVAFQKLNEFRQTFHQRTTLIESIPKFSINHDDIERLFSPKKETKMITPTEQSLAATPTTANNDFLHDDDDEEKNNEKKSLTHKELARQGKVIEQEKFDGDDRSTDVGSEPVSVLEHKESAFGSRSRLQATPRPFTFSTRLRPSTNNQNGSSFSRRTFTPTSSPVLPAEHSKSMNNDNFVPLPREDLFDNVKLDIVQAYAHERNIFLLMACSARHIILFRSQRNRVDRWKLGSIERGSGAETNLDWHDGLIISMGFINAYLLYIFTERSFIRYNFSTRRIVDSRILPRGNDDEPATSESPYDDIKRGLGTVHKAFRYDLYLGRTSCWTLSKHLLSRMSHLPDINLSERLPFVSRFLHIHVNDESINFLVELENGAHAVVFCSENDCYPLSTSPHVQLQYSQQPLSLCSAYIQQLKRYLFFVNDPSSKTIHILDNRCYLCAYPVVAHAISYVPETNQLLIASDKCICVMDFNDPTLFS